MHIQIVFLLFFDRDHFEQALKINFPTPAHFFLNVPRCQLLEWRRKWVWLEPKSHIKGLNNSGVTNMGCCGWIWKKGSIFTTIFSKYYYGKKNNKSPFSTICTPETYSWKYKIIEYKTKPTTITTISFAIE